MGRITDAFHRMKTEGRTGLVTYLTAGFPHPDLTPALVAAMEEGGADLIELGIPFSDPLADGTTIQRANFAALRQGVTPWTCLEVVREVRRRGVQAPLLLMGYYNPVLAYGQEDFCRDAAAAGVDGLIIVDLPPEEGDDLRRAAGAHGLDLICLVAPTSTDDRIARLVELASGFIYCVSVAGVTGARQELPPTLPAFLERVRSRTHLPLAVGFGIASRRQVEQVGAAADAVVVGSALIDVLERAPHGQEVQQVRQFVAELAGRPAEASRATGRSAED
ncbi:MAG: tryptophan synthase subunit alpha [Chloroflexi bacterium]|nr:tryptophan synthase subunit alpha [Chloroflexota bacterium]